MIRIGSARVGWVSALMVVAAISIVGCGGEAAPSGDDSGATTDGASLTLLPLKVVAKDSLPIDTNRSIRAIDEGIRINVSCAKDWEFLPRRSEYIAALYSGDPNSPPLIFVRRADYTLEGFDTLSKENVEAFAEAVAAHLASVDVKVVEPPRAMMLGPTPVARYVRGGKWKNASIERQFLMTSHNGVVYEIELQVLTKTIRKSRDASYAVAASLVFEDAE